MFLRTTAINKILAMKARKRVIQGGTWAGKTYGILAAIINHAASNPNKFITVTAETIPALKGGAMRQFREIMQLTGRWVQTRWNGTDYFYSFANGSVVEFKSFDSVGKAQAAGKRTDLFINEGPYINYDIADALIMRTEGIIWIDFNPTQEYWAHTEILPNNDAEFLLLKATDNEALPVTIQNELNIKLGKAADEKELGLPITSYWQNWCRVYIDGEIGNLQGVVFNNWEQCDTVPNEASLIAYGLDFGFTNDPTALPAVYKQDGCLILDLLLYQTGLLNSEIISNMTNFEVGTKRVVADSAEPKSIAEIKRSGFRVEPAKKGPDSIKASIDLLQTYKIKVTKRSVDLIKELRAYRWKVDKSGKTLNEPIDYMNHAIDAVRYVALNCLAKKNTMEIY